MENKTDDLFLGSLTDDAIDIEQESFLTPSDDEDEVINDDFYIPEPVSDGNNNDPTQILISTDASCNIRTSAGCCVIINDITFGTQMRSLPHVSTDSFVAELSTMTEAVKWGTQLVREARSLGHNQIETLHVVSDCQDAVEWWNTALTRGPDSANYAINVAMAAYRAQQMGLRVKATWRRACGTKALALADWISRFISEIDALSRFNIDIQQFAGISFDLYNLSMQLPNGRIAEIRLKEHPTKIGFNFRDLFGITMREVREQEAGASRKRKADNATLEVQDSWQRRPQTALTRHEEAMPSHQTADVPFCIRCKEPGHSAFTCTRGDPDLLCVWCGTPGHFQISCSRLAEFVHGVVWMYGGRG